MRVVEGELVLTHVLTGSLVARDAVDFAAPDIGIFPLQLQYLAENGSRVVAGDPVVSFDNSTLVSQIENLERQIQEAETALELAVAQATADVGQAQFDLLSKRATLEKARIEAAVPEGLMSEFEYANLQLALDKALLEEGEAVKALDAAEAAAEAEVAIKRVELEKALRSQQSSENKLARLELQAPREGVVVLQENWDQDRMVQSGDSVQPGMTVARIPDLSTLIVRAQLYDVDDGVVEAGQSAQIVLDAFPDRVIDGVVKRVDALAQQVSRRSRRRHFGVEVSLGEIDLDRFRPGMSARVLVHRPSAPDGEPSLLVPRAAVDFSQPQVRVQLANGDLRDAEIGACNATNCVLLAGLELGQPVAPVLMDVER